MPRNAFALLSAIAMLLLLSGAAMFLARIIASSHNASQNGYILAQVSQAANSGLEWGIYHAMQSDYCTYADKVLALEDDFVTQVSCTIENYPDEGVDIMKILSAASFGTLGDANYVTRTMEVYVTNPP